MKRWTKPWFWCWKAARTEREEEGRGGQPDHTGGQGDAVMFVFVFACVFREALR